MAKIGELIINLKANTATFASDMKKASDISARTGAQIGKSLELMTKAAAAGSLAAGAAVFAIANKTADYGDELIKASQKTGVAIEQLGGLRFAAEQSGVEFAILQKGIQILARNLSGLSASGKELEKGMGALGLTARDAAGNLRPMHDILLDVADRFAKAKDSGEKSAIAMTVFGKSGAALIPMLNAGREGIEALEKQAEKLGLVFSEKDALAAQTFKDELNVLNRALDGLEFRIGLKVIPSLLDFGVKLQNIGIELQWWTHGILSAGLAIYAYEQFFARNFGKATVAMAEARKEADLMSGSEEKWIAAMSAGTASVQAQLKGLKALHDLPQDFHIEETHKAKKVRDDLSASVAQFHGLVMELRPEVEGLAAAEGKFLDTQLKIAAIGDKVNASYLTELNSVRMLKETTAALAKIRAEADAQVSKNVPVLPPLPDWLQTPAPIFDTFNELRDKAKEFGKEMSGAFTQMIIYGRGFGDSLKSLLALLAEAIVKTYVFGTISKALSGSSGFPGLIGSFLGGLAGARADGGPVQAGRPYLVGERGPEMFVPSMGGQIVAAGAGGATVNFAIDARGADPGSAFAVRRALKMAERRLVSASLQAVRNRSIRTGA